MKIHLSNASLTRQASSNLPTVSVTQSSAMGNWKLKQLLSTDETPGQILRYSAAPIGSTQKPDYLVHTPADSTSTIASSLLNRESIISQHVTSPHLLPVLDVHLNTAPFFIVTPRLPGSSLSVVLSQKGQLDFYHGLWILRQSAQAVAALHTHGWSNPRIEPENMMIEPDGHLTLIASGHAQPLASDTEIDDREKVYTDICRLAALFLQMTNCQSYGIDSSARNRFETEQANLSHGPPTSVTTLLNEMLNPHTPCNKKSVSHLVDRIVRLEIDFLSKTA